MSANNRAKGDLLGENFPTKVSSVSSSIKRVCRVKEIQSENMSLSDVSHEIFSSLPVCFALFAGMQ